MDNRTPRVAILIPTLGRAHKLEALIKNIREVTPEPHEIYFMTSDDDSIGVIKENGAVHIPDTGRTDYVYRTNALFKATEEPFVFTGSDDVVFHKGWLTELLRHVEHYGVVVPDDGLNPNGTLALIGREYIKRRAKQYDYPEEIFYPEYRHAYSETELFDIAKKDDEYIRVSDSLVEHQHPDGGKSVVDDTYREAWKHNADGQKLYDSRKHLFKV